MNNTYMVYCHTNLKNGKRYVGISHLKTYKRWGHEGNGYKNCTLFWKAIKKYGWSGFNHTVLHNNLSKEEAEALEIKYISDWKLTNPKFGYNLLEGGNANLPSEQTRKKMSKSIGNYYKNNPEARERMRKISVSYFSNPENRKKESERVKRMYKERPEIIEKIRATVKRNYKERPDILEKMKACWDKRRNDPSYKNKCRERALRLYRENPDIRKRLSDAHKGLGIKAVLCVELDKEFPSIKSVCEFFNISRSCMTDVLRGKQKTCCGYHWKYVEPEYE